MGTERIDDSTSHLEAFLAGVKFPAEKDDVIQAALHNGAPKEVLDVVEHLARQRFVVPQDLLEAYTEIWRLRHHLGH